MKEKKDFPPNYGSIKMVFPYEQGTVYCYGDLIYNPSGESIPEDVLYHESIHSKQQNGNPEQWWTKYILDEDFRWSQELEAFAHQYQFIRKHYPTKAHSEALEELAFILKTRYNIHNLSLEQAKTAIRKHVI